MASDLLLSSLQSPDQLADHQDFSNFQKLQDSAQLRNSGKQLQFSTTQNRAPLVSDLRSILQTPARDSQEIISSLYTLQSAKQGPSLTTSNEKLPIFDGYNPEEWIMKAEEIFSFFKKSLDDKINMSAQHFSSNAIVWYYGRINEFVSWEHFTQSLIERFSTNESDGEISRSIYAQYIREYDCIQILHYKLVCEQHGEGAQILNEFDYIQAYLDAYAKYLASENVVTENVVAEFMAENDTITLEAWPINALNNVHQSSTDVVKADFLPDNMLVSGSTRGIERGLIGHRPVDNNLSEYEYIQCCLQTFANDQYNEDPLSSVKENDNSGEVLIGSDNLSTPFETTLIDIKHHTVQNCQILTSAFGRNSPYHIVNVENVRNNTDNERGIVATTPKYSLGHQYSTLCGKLFDVVLGLSESSRLNVLVSRRKL